jgi:hypothetical protein
MATHAHAGKLNCGRWAVSWQWAELELGIGRLVMVVCCGLLPAKHGGKGGADGSGMWEWKQWDMA